MDSMEEEAKHHTWSKFFAHYSQHVNNRCCTKDTLLSLGTRRIEEHRDRASYFVHDHWPAVDHICATFLLLFFFLLLHRKVSEASSTSWRACEWSTTTKKASSRPWPRYDQQRCQYLSPFFRSNNSNKKKRVRRRSLSRHLTVFVCDFDFYIHTSMSTDTHIHTHTHAHKQTHLQ